jgi:hypothetical protein
MRAQWGQVQEWRQSYVEAGQFLAALRAPKLIGRIGVRALQLGGVVQAAGLVLLIVLARQA